MPTALLVDDSFVARRVGRNIVEGVLPNHEILIAVSGKAALELLTSRSGFVDLAVLDYNMDGMDGLELAAELKERHPESRLMLCTANLQRSLSERAAALGVNVIQKPLTAAKLEEALANSRSAE